ncbi:hypothetical protein PMIN01_11894 [Paraphaeosphaeria minitans]|uniref:Uncharacterized protein n=1 Tax=Paraphaeosphaeria minitans TaxID=565426 RepID=A0A9P6G456_9PLEO|nr:hypothetical protein PMIN01_13620 [Paraphaeosphaeria minitans]KAF9729961.1 hypothetical protein PMIN01_11894 [Paraphaeosphaeria minitans]
MKSDLQYRSVRFGAEHPSTLTGISNLAIVGAPREVRGSRIDEQAVAGAAREGARC